MPPFSDHTAVFDDDRADQADEQGDLAAIEQAQQEIAAKLVGAQRMAGTRPREAAEQVRDRLLQDPGGLGHLDHEGRAPPADVVRGADAGEDAVIEQFDHAISRMGVKELELIFGIVDRALLRPLPLPESERLEAYRPDLVIPMNPIYLEEIRADLARRGLTPELLAV